MVFVAVERNSYIFDEEDDETDICVTIVSPVIEIPVDFPFSLQLSTIDGTAG